MAKKGQVASPDALRVFISSRMDELAPERAAVRQALANAGCAPWLYEVDAGARPGPPRETYLDELYKSDVYLGLFWKTRGAYTIDEFDAARRNRIACLVYEKTAADRHSDLSSFLDVIGDVEEGVTIRRFDTPEHLVDLVTPDIEHLQHELVRVRGTDGRTYTGTRHGGRFDRTSATTPIRRPPLHASNGPRPPDPFVDRTGPVGRLREAIAAGEPLVGVTGVPGIGKSSVLRWIARDPGAGTERFPDGVGVYIEGERWPRAGDLLRALWSELYRVNDRRFVPDDTELRADLGDSRALVFVDGVRLAADDIDTVHAHVPGSTFVLAANSPETGDVVPLAYAKAVTLAGFDQADDILTLFGASYRQTVPVELADGVLTICGRAGASPGTITKLANEAWGSDLPLAEWLAALAEADLDPVRAVMVGDLSGDDRWVLGLLAAFGTDVATPREVMARLGVRSDRIERLVGSGDVEDSSEGLRLGGAVYSGIRKMVDVKSLRLQVFDATVKWVGEATPIRLREARAFIQRVLEWGAEQDNSRGVVRLARALAPQLAVSGAWDSWAIVTDHALLAARALHDNETGAWALHETGTRQLMQGETRAARRSLRAAHRLRRREGDRAASVLTAHNLSRTRAFSASGRTAAVLVGVAVLIVAVALLVRAGSVLDFGEVSEGSTVARYQIFSNGTAQRTEYEIEITGDSAFCVESLQGMMCGPSPSRTNANVGPAATGVEIPECASQQLGDRIVSIRVEPRSECALPLWFSPILGPEETRKDFLGELRIVGGDVETVGLRGVGVRIGEVTTTTIGTSTTSLSGEPTSTVQENRPPIATDDRVEVAEGGSVDIFVLGNDGDPDSDALTVELMQMPGSGEPSLGAQGLITYFHDGSETTADSLSYRISDGELNSNEATVTIEVVPVNDPPQAVDDPAETDEGGRVRVDVLSNDDDPEGDPLTVESTSPPAHGTVEIAGGGLLYVHDGSDTTSDSFEYTVVDDNGARASATVNVTINPINTPPVANDLTPLHCVTSPSSITLTGSDADGDDLQFSIRRPPIIGSLSNFEQTSNTQAAVTYTRNGTNYSETFEFQVDDGVTTDSSTVEVNVEFCVE